VWGVVTSGVEGETGGTGYIFPKRNSLGKRVPFAARTTAVKRTQTLGLEKRLEISRIMPVLRCQKNRVNRVEKVNDSLYGSVKEANAKPRREGGNS